MASFFQEIMLFLGYKLDRPFFIVYFQVESFDELLVWKAEPALYVTDQELARKKVKQLVGSLVLFPMNFLKRENLSPTIGTKEGLVPSSVFT